MADFNSQTDLAFSPTPEYLADTFRELALELSHIGASIDVPIRAFKTEAMPYFMAMDLNGQQDAVMKLAQYVSICQDVLASGGDLRSTRTFVWRAFRAFGMKPNASFFESMSEDHVVEIYDLNNVQIFRNFRFFEFCSYTLEDVFTRPWTDLFIRKQPAQTTNIVGFIEKLVASGSHETVTPHAGVQHTREANSELMHEVDLEIDSAALLFNEANVPAALIVCEKVEFARAQTTAHTQKEKEQPMAAPLFRS